MTSDSHTRVAGGFALLTREVSSGQAVQIVCVPCWHPFGALIQIHIEYCDGNKETARLASNAVVPKVLQVPRQHSARHLRGAGAAGPVPSDAPARPWQPPRRRAQWTPSSRCSRCGSSARPASSPPASEAGRCGSRRRSSSSHMMHGKRLAGPSASWRPGGFNQR
eukprot:scaffold32178_cov59-Phaeocystis_antarctica.AAC.3